MARARRTNNRRYRFWRWRRNPLRRRCDIVEGWLLVITWTLTVLAGVLVGTAAAGTVDRALETRRAQVHEVSAVLTGDASRTASGPTGYDDGRVWASVRWTAPDGTVRTGQAKVSPGTAEGTRVTVWTNNAHRIVTPPLTPRESALQAALTGAFVAPAAAAAVWAAGRLVRGRLIRRCLAEWDEEWKRVGPQWRNLSGGRG
ncbi:hypothetical protein AB0F77_12060 [Streptomyces sp. NPDC026672]|uniref:Rv1733c family protein n=1 Tax=unclassified Streptomyces TaxID=2593676 RepID=UPI0033C16A2D